MTDSAFAAKLATNQESHAVAHLDALGVAETTVKFHLRNLFEKTDTHRQADLVRLVAGFCNPLIG